MYMYMYIQPEPAIVFPSVTAEGSILLILLLIIRDLSRITCMRGGGGGGGGETNRKEIPPPPALCRKNPDYSDAMFELFEPMSNHICYHASRCLGQALMHVCLST